MTVPNANAKAAPATTTTTRPEGGVDPLTWQKIQRFMLRHAGVELRDDQIYLAEARLSGATKANSLKTIAEFVSAASIAAAGSKLFNALMEAMTTHETYFYRDAPFWQTFESTVIPKLAARAKAGARPTIWSAACSSGQEPYSIVMMLEDKVPEVAAKVEIIATDISELTVSKAREGLFTALEVNRNLGAARMMKHFTQAPGGFRVRDDLRKRITFKVHNLLGANLDPSGCDIVLCRNVLIYFGPTDRTSVLNRLATATRPDGYIGLGSTETWREAKSVAAGWFQRPARP